MLVVALVQVPVDALIRCPTRAVPEIAGTVTFTGALAFARTTAVTFENADVLPAAFAATIVARISMPTWLAPSRRLDPVLPARSVQTELVAVQLCHW